MVENEPKTNLKANGPSLRRFLLKGVIGIENSFQLAGIPMWKILIIQK